MDLPRALGVEDLRGALEKMTRWARRRCYATLHAAGDFLGDDVRAALGREVAPRPGYIYAVNMLYQMGFPARVDFLKSTGGMTYADAGQFLEAVRWRIGELARHERRLRRFFALPQTGMVGGSIVMNLSGAVSWEKPGPGARRWRVWTARGPWSG